MQRLQEGGLLCHGSRLRLCGEAGKNSPGGPTTCSWPWPSPRRRIARPPKPDSEAGLQAKAARRPAPAGHGRSGRKASLERHTGATEVARVARAEHAPTTRTWAQLVLQHEAGEAFRHVEQVLRRRRAEGAAAAAAAPRQAEQYGGRDAVTGCSDELRFHAAGLAERGSPQSSLRMQSRGCCR